MGVASAFLQVGGGLAARKEADRQAVEALRQGDIARQEAEAEAQRRRREVKQTKSKQLVGFLKSGVSLEGTPFAVLQETERLGAEEVSAIRRAGFERQRAFGAQARALRVSGRQQLLTGISGAVGTLSGTARTAAGFGGVGG